MNVLADLGKIQIYTLQKIRSSLDLVARKLPHGAKQLKLCSKHHTATSARNAYPSLRHHLTHRFLGLRACTGTVLRVYAGACDEVFLVRVEKIREPKRVTRDLLNEHLHSLPGKGKRINHQATWR